MDYVKEAKELGFSNAAIMDTQKLIFKPEYRRFCEENQCGCYNVNPACPPESGTVEAMKQCAVTNEKTLTGMLAVTDGKAVTAQTTADAAKSTAQTALSKATANETKLNTIPEMPENDGKIYGFCNGAWVVIAEVGKNVYTD